MGSGKSAVGLVLADLLNFKFLDLDHFIEREESMEIPEIFKEKGEIYFRKREHQILKDILKNENQLVLSLGGGTPCYSNNMDLIKSHNDAVTIYLKASLANLTNRLINEKEHRPLLSQITSKEALSEFIAKHLFERRPYYNQADFEIVVDDQKVETIAREILLDLYQ